MEWSITRLSVPYKLECRSYNRGDYLRARLLSTQRVKVFNCFPMYTWQDTQKDLMESCKPDANLMSLRSLKISSSSKHSRCENIPEAKSIRLKLSNLSCQNSSREKNIAFTLELGIFAMRFWFSLTDALSRHPTSIFSLLLKLPFIRQIACTHNGERDRKRKRNSSAKEQAAACAWFFNGPIGDARRRWTPDGSGRTLLN